jgi:hypothetical protein
MSEQPKIEQIGTPAGPITTTTHVVPATPQSVVLASKIEIQKLNELARQAKRFAISYIPEAINPSLKDLDNAFHAWQIEKDRQFTEQQVIEILGAYAGCQLVENLNMEWVIVTDEYGTDFAVRDKKYEVMSFPFSSVAKRIQDKQFDFMNGVYHAVKNAIESGAYKRR